MALTWYEKVNNLPPNYDWNLAIVLLAMCGSSLSSRSVGDNHSDSIRDLETHPAVKFFFSTMQLGMTSHCLYGLRRFSFMFFMAAMLQVTPFLMTLRRKNLLSTPVGIAAYAVQLIFGWSMGEYEANFSENVPHHCSLTIGMLIDAAVLLRMGPRLPLLRIVQENKYLLWLVLGLALRRLRPVLDQEVLPQEIVTASWVLKACICSLFVWKGFLRDKFRLYGTTTPVSKKVM